MLMWARLWRAGQSPVLAMCVPSLKPLTLTGPASLSATGDTGHCRFIATDPGSACCSGLDFQLPTRFWPCPSHRPVQLDFIFIAEKWVGPPLTNFYKLGSCGRRRLLIRPPDRSSLSKYGLDSCSPCVKGSQHRHLLAHFCIVGSNF